MIGKIGLGQIAVLLVIFTILFGYRKLPELGQGLGKALREFRKSLHEPDAMDVTTGTDKKLTGDRTVGNK